MSWVRERYRIILFASVTISVVLGVLVSFWVFNPLFTAATTSEKQDYYQTMGIEIRPYLGGEIWTAGGKLHVYDRIRISNTTTTPIEVTLGNSTYLLQGSPIYLDSSILGDGSHWIWVRNSTTISGFTMVVENKGYLWTWTANLGWIGFFVFSSIIPSYALPFLLLVSPLRESRKKGALSREDDSAVKKPAKDKAGDLVIRANRLVDYQVHQSELYEKKNARLLMAIAALLAGYLASISVLVTAAKLVEDIEILLQVGTGFTIGIAFLLLSILNLISGADHADMFYTKYFHEGQVAESINPETLDLDLRRVDSTLRGWDASAAYVDGINELVRLYHEVRLLRERYESATSYFKMSLIMTGFVFMLILLRDSWLAPLIETAYAWGMAIFAFAVVVMIPMLWYWEDMRVLKRTIYYTSNKVDTSKMQNKRFEESERFWVSVGVRPAVVTEKIIDDVRKKVESAPKLKGPKPKDSNLLKFYGPSDGSYDWCGREVPILLVEDVEKNKVVEVYPCRKKKKKIGTIYDYLLKMSERG